MNVNAASLIWAVLVFLGFIASVCLHEFGHAIVAFWGGDHSVKDKGYLTLNPLKYTHPTYSIVMPLIFLLLGGLPLPGAAVYINVNALKNRTWRSAVAGAGPLATLGVAVAVAAMIRGLNPDYERAQAQFLADNLSLTQVSAMSWLLQGLALLLVLEVAGVILNLIPMPGLDGFGIIEPWLTKSVQQKARQFSRFGILILFGAFWVVPQFNQGFWTLVHNGVRYLGVPPDFADLGFYLFRQNAQLMFFVLLVGLVIANQWKKRYAPVTVQPSATLDESLAQIDSQLALKPDASLLSKKGFLLIQLERYNEALIALKQSLDLEPGQLDCLMAQAKLCQILHRYEDAIAAFHEALALDPLNPHGWKELGDTFIEVMDYVQALEAYDKALAYAPDPLYYSNLLLLKSLPYFRLERYSDCIELLDKFLMTHPDNATAWYNKACCYARLNELDAGILSLKKALFYGNDEFRETAMLDEDIQLLRSHPSYPDLRLDDSTS